MIVNSRREKLMTTDARHVVWFEELRRDDVPRVGGKNASLGETEAFAKSWRDLMRCLVAKSEGLTTAKHG